MKNSDKKIPDNEIRIKMPSPIVNIVFYQINH
jgi:hypothetical protein